MKILFVHWVFPGQFVHLAPALKARGHDVRVLMDAAHPTPADLPTETYVAPGPSGPTHPLIHLTQSHVLRGEAVALKAQAMREAGFVPDLIVAHFGLGESLFLKDVFPESKLIVYSDLCFNHADVNFDPEFRPDNLKHRMEVTSLAPSFLTSMARADRLWTPTQWQASTHPSAFRDKLSVIFDGIDTEKCRPNRSAALHVVNKGVELRHGDEVLTFVSRNLEPLRGYHRFMRALPEIMERRPNCHVVIVGGHGVSYGSPSPDGRPWKSVFLSEVKHRLDPKRVHILGAVPYDRFIEICQVSRAHVYLTQPFVLSWSFFEAMSCGAMVIGSRTAPLAELIDEGRNGLLADYFDTAELVEKVTDALARPAHYEKMRKQARKTIVSRYDTRSVCLPRQIEMCEGLVA